MKRMLFSAFALFFYLHYRHKDCNKARKSRNLKNNPYICKKSTLNHLLTYWNSFADASGFAFTKLWKVSKSGN